MDQETIGIFWDNSSDSDSGVQDQDYLSILNSRVDSFTQFENNWDGYDGLPLFGNIAAQGKSFITMMDDHYVDQISDIYPNPNGTLTIEWKNIQGEKLSLEIGENNYSYFIKYKDSPPFLFNGDGSVTHSYHDIQTKLAQLFILKDAVSIWTVD